jgi:hypothetical protein
MRIKRIDAYKAYSDVEKRIDSFRRVSAANDNVGLKLWILADASL